jgi:hypothetical protein
LSRTITAGREGEQDLPADWVRIVAGSRKCNDLVPPFRRDDKKCPGANYSPKLLLQNNLRRIPEAQTSLKASNLRDFVLASETLVVWAARGSANGPTLNTNQTIANFCLTAGEFYPVAGSLRAEAAVRCYHGTDCRKPNSGTVDFGL